MFYNRKYIFGDQSVSVPAHLNFGKYMLDGLRRRKNEVAFLRNNTREQLTYEEVTHYAVSLAVSLKKLGSRVGKTVAVGSERRNEVIPSMLGIVFSGATATLYDLECGRAVLQHKLSLAKPEFFICSNRFYNKFSDILKACDCLKAYISLDDDVTDSIIPVKSLISKDVDIDHFEPERVHGQTDVAYLLYSSGTTGMPKGVELTHLNCILSSLPHKLDDDSLKTVYVFGTWFHNYDTFMAYRYLSCGKKLVYSTDSTIPLMLNCVQDQQVNIAMLTPDVLGYLCKNIEMDDFNLESLKLIYSRSAPLHLKTIEELKRRLPKLENVLQGYGMTECGEPASDFFGTKGIKPGSVGMLSPGMILKIVDRDTNEVLGVNQRGEIRLSSPVLMKGYKGVESSSYLDEEGFLKTGDLGYYDEDGYVFIVDRISEIMNCIGVQVAPLELETILQLHPEVKEAGVVGKPHPHFGQLPTAFVVRHMNSKVTEEELKKYVDIEVPPYMQLKGGIIFLEELPRNPRGKILRRRLREMLSDYLNCLDSQLINKSITV